MKYLGMVLVTTLSYLLIQHAGIANRAIVTRCKARGRMIFSGARLWIILLTSLLAAFAIFFLGTGHNTCKILVNIMHF